MPWLLMSTLVLAQDAPEALASACEQGEAESCAALGQLYAQEDGPVATDTLRALRLFDRGCKLGSAEACGEGAELLLEGLRVPPDRERGWSMMLAGCELGDLEQCRTLIGRVPPQELPEEGAERTVHALQAGCVEGDDYACGGLGLASALGFGTPRDGGWGVQVLTESCEAGDAASCRDLALLHEHGTSVPRDKDKAREWALQGCSLGDAEACELLPRRLQKRLP